MDESSELIQQRIRKIETMRAEGIEPFPNDFKVSHNAREIHEAFNSKSDEELKAADDMGMLVAFSQPHCQHYQWTGQDAERTNGYARHAAFYARVAGNHPAVVMYSMNHNALSYFGDTDPDLTDGRHNAEGKIGPRTDRGALVGLMATRGCSTV